MPAIPSYEIDHLAQARVEAGRQASAGQTAFGSVIIIQQQREADARVADAEWHDAFMARFDQLWEEYDREFAVNVS